MRCRSNLPRSFGQLVELGLVTAMLAALISSARAAEPQQAADNVTVWSNLKYSEASDACILDLAVPKVRVDKPRPLIVVIHGGGWLEGDKSSFSNLEQRTPGNIFDFAARGFVAATINYRLSGEAPYPAALDDCRQAIAWLAARAGQYRLDPERIGVYGNSAGGHLALLLAMTDPAESAGGKPARAGRVKAAASDSGPLDLLYGYQHNQLQVVIERFLGGPPEGDRTALYHRAAPTSCVRAGLPPLLLIYGGQDEQVDVRTSDRFVAALGETAGSDVSYFRLAEVGHCPHSIARVPYLRSVVEDFFLRVLKP